jgi:hypothetical protein
MKYMRTVPVFRVNCSTVVQGLLPVAVRVVSQLLALSSDANPVLSAYLVPRREADYLK